MKGLKFIAIIFLVISCNVLQKDDVINICYSGNFYQKVETIPIIDVDKLKKFNGRFIQVSGILHYRFEDVAIYPIGSKKTEEALWLDLQVPTEVSEVDLERVDGQQVNIIGRVNLSKKGHWGGYQASLDSAFCIKGVNK